MSGQEGRRGHAELWSFAATTWVIVFVWRRPYIYIYIYVHIHTYIYIYMHSAHSPKKRTIDSDLELRILLQRGVQELSTAGGLLEGLAPERNGVVNVVAAVLTTGRVLLSLLMTSPGHPSGQCKL